MGIKNEEKQSNKAHNAEICKWKKNSENTVERRKLFTSVRHTPFRFSPIWKLLRKKIAIKNEYLFASK